MFYARASWLDSVIEAGRGDELAVARPGDAVDGVRMTREQVGSRVGHDGGEQVDRPKYCQWILSTWSIGSQKPGVRSTGEIHVSD